MRCRKGKDANKLDEQVIIMQKQIQEEKKEEKKTEELNFVEKLMQMQCKVDKLGNHKLNYISWAEAWGALKKEYPGSQFKVFENPQGLPYFEVAGGAMVKVSVSILSYKEIIGPGIEHTLWMPVLDGTNKSKKFSEITTFDINKAIQRGLAKAIALHGLGLYVYQGEDYPEDSQQEQKPQPQESKQAYCADCQEAISEKVRAYSVDKFQRPLCMSCQKAAQHDVKGDE